MLSFLLLSAVTIAGASMVFMDFSDEDDEDAVQPDDSVEPPGTEPIFDITTLPDIAPASSATNTVTISESGEDFAGGEDADSVILETQASGNAGQAEYASGGVHYVAEDGANPVTNIDTGAGNDQVTVRSGFADITTGDGADTVDASGLQGGIIRAGSGDLIFGSDVATDPNAFYANTAVGAELHDDVDYRGGAADEYIAAFGDGATVDGGPGDDVILNFDGAATLSGGAGDDLIDAHAFAEEYDQNSIQRFNTGDGHADMVDGGDGNDRIFVDGGDTVTGGSGSDQIEAAFHFGTGSEPVIITDFQPSEDQIFLNISDFVPPSGDTNDGPMDPSGHVTIMEGDGDSHVFVDEELVAVLENTQGLSASTIVVPDTPDSTWHGLQIRLG